MQLQFSCKQNILLIIIKTKKKMRIVFQTQCFTQCSLLNFIISIAK